MIYAGTGSYSLTDAGGANTKTNMSFNFSPKMLENISNGNRSSLSQAAVRDLLHKFTHTKQVVGSLGAVPQTGG
jgi:hypothetical protein